MSRTHRSIHSRPGRTRRRAVSTVLLTLCLLTQAGCQGSVPEETQARNDEHAAELVSTLYEALDVDDAEVSYNDDATSSYRSLDIRLECADCDPAQTAEAAVGPAWRSPIGPLAWLVVRVEVPGEPERTERLELDVEDPEVRAQLEEEHGARPEGAGDE